MKMTKFYMKNLLASVGIVLALNAHAAFAQMATFSYQRGTITIQRATPPVIPPLPWQPAGQPVVTAQASKDITVDIRSAKTLRQQEGWVDVSSATSGQGTLFVYEKPQKATIKQTSIYAPMDVLWINPEGKIVSVAPSMILANLNTPISVDKTKAILLLAGGLCKQEQISLGDVVVNADFFTPAPPVLQLPQAPTQ